LSEVPADQLAELFMAVMLVTIRNWLISKAEEPLDERLLRAWRVRDGCMRLPASAENPARVPAKGSGIHRPRPGRSRSRR